MCVYESGHQINPLPVSCHLILAPPHMQAYSVLCVRLCKSEHCPHHLACGSHWRRRRDLQAAGLIDTSHFRCLCCGRNMEVSEIRGSVKRRERSGRKARWSGEMKKEEQLEWEDSTGGRKNCEQRVGQLIFYKPGLERSWNEEWEKDSWASATGIRREKEWDSWITLLWSETSAGEKRRECWEWRDWTQTHLSVWAGFTLISFAKNHADTSTDFSY